MSEQFPESRERSSEETGAAIARVLGRAAWFEEIDPSYNEGSITTEELAAKLGIELPERE